MKRLDAWFYARAIRRELARHGKIERPAIVDAHFEWPDGVGAWQAARRLGLPFVCTLRGKLVSQTREPAKRRRIREMLLGADALIAVSRSLAELANEVAGRDLGVRVIPNGIDGGVFRRLAATSPNSYSAEARSACGWDSEAKYVVSVGHLQILKGFHHLVEVWPEVRRRVGDVRLVLVGGPAGEPSYERALRESIQKVCGAAVPAVGSQAGRLCHREPESQAGRLCHRPAGEGRESIVLAGRLPPERVATMLNAADMFVLASRSEGWCNSIAEALACGCPVVATNVGGNREIVSSPDFGRLVRPDHAEALTDGICGALGEAWDRERIAAANGRRTWQQVARECVDVFEEVTRRAGRSAG